MFSDIFMQILHERGMKPYHISKLTGISAGLISDYANGKKQPTLVNLLKIADVLGISVDELLGRDKKQIDNSLMQMSEEDQKSFQEYKNLSEEDKHMVASLVQFLIHRKLKNTKLNRDDSE